MPRSRLPYHPNPVLILCNVWNVLKPFPRFFRNRIFANFLNNDCLPPTRRHGQTQFPPKRTPTSGSDPEGNVSVAGGSKHAGKCRASAPPLCDLGILPVIFSWRTGDRDPRNLRRLGNFYKNHYFAYVNLWHAIYITSTKPCYLHKYIYIWLWGVLHN